MSPRTGWRTGIVLMVLVIAVVLATGATVVVRSTKAEGGSVPKAPALPRLGPIQMVDQNDVGDPFVLPVQPGVAPPRNVPFQTSGPDAYQSAPWPASTAARAKAHGWYVLFGTTDWQENVPTAISIDLAHWTQAPDALPVLPSWATPSISMTWAPAAMKTSAGWILYFSTEDALSHLECIGAAVSVAPAGPYTSRARRPLVCQQSLGGSIDPTIVHGAEGSHFLIWKNDGNAVGRSDAIWSQALADNGLRLVGAPHELMGADEPWEQGIIEAPAMVPATDGGYWLFFAGGNWNTNRYGTGLAHCSSITGPCTDTSTRPFLATGPSLISPGGLEIFTDRQGRLWAGFTGLVLVPSTWHPGRYYYNRVLDIARVLSR